MRGTRLEGDPAAVAADAARARAAWADAYPQRVVVAPLDDSGFALPAAAWSAYSGDALVFVTRGGVPAVTSRVLSELRRGAGNDLSIYVIAPRSRISTAVAAELRRFGSVQRVGGRSPMLLSIELARYDDPHTDFGWGLRKGRANLLLASTRDLPSGSAALAFAAAGPRAPLLLTDDGRTLPPQLLGYLRSLRSSEGPGQGFVFGSPAAVSSEELRQVDAALSTR